MPIFDKAIIGAGGGAMYYLDARMGSDLTTGIRAQLTEQFNKIGNLEDRKKALRHLLFVGDKDVDMQKAPEDKSLLDLTSKSAVFANTVLIGKVGVWRAVGPPEFAPQLAAYLSKLRPGQPRSLSSPILWHD